MLLLSDFLEIPRWGNIWSSILYKVHIVHSKYIYILKNDGFECLVLAFFIIFCRLINLVTLLVLLICCLLQCGWDMIVLIMVISQSWWLCTEMHLTSCSIWQYMLSLFYVHNCFLFLICLYVKLLELYFVHTIRVPNWCLSCSGGSIRGVWDGPRQHTSKACAMMMFTRNHSIAAHCACDTLPMQARSMVFFYHRICWVARTSHAWCPAMTSLPVNIIMVQS